jgi:hypothetical protein
MYDVIGDVHGQGGKLKALLRQLGYIEGAGHWQAPQGRQAVFVGDLIDRGPNQLEVLRLVKAMVDAGQAQVVLGNHEFNAIGYAVKAAGAEAHLRPRSEKNRKQHARFLEEVKEDSKEHQKWVDWFRTLPMALDMNGIRVVHAWWDEQAVARIERARGGSHGLINDDVLHSLYADPDLQAARKLLTCGVEWELPPGLAVVDKEGHRHGEARLAVWRHWADRLRQIALVPGDGHSLLPDIDVPKQHPLVQVTGSPILFGHHWFSGPVKLETPKVACLDWSAAKGGPLVAYRWDGEDELRHQGLVAVDG